MPPMLDVAFGELTARTERDLRPEKPWIRMHQSHRVLQLIAKPVGAARLVIAAACPKAAGERLIHEPAVGQHIKRQIGCVYLQGCKSVLPMLCHGLERVMRGRGSSKSVHQPAGRFCVRGCAEAKNDFALLPFGQVERHLHRCTRIKRSAHFTGKTGAVHSRWLTQCAVATEKFGAVAADRSGGLVDVEESDPPREFAVERI